MKTSQKKKTVYSSLFLNTVFTTTEKKAKMKQCRIRTQTPTLKPTVLTIKSFTVENRVTLKHYISKNKVLEQPWGHFTFL